MTPIQLIVLCLGWIWYSDNFPLNGSPLIKAKNSKDKPARTTTNTRVVMRCRCTFSDITDVVGGKEIKMNHKTNNLVYPTAQTGAKVKTYNTHIIPCLFSAIQGYDDYLRGGEGCGAVLASISRFSPSIV